MRENIIPVRKGLLKGSLMLVEAIRERIVALGASAGGDGTVFDAFTLNYAKWDFKFFKESKLSYMHTAEYSSLTKSSNLISSRSYTINNAINEISFVTNAHLLCELFRLYQIPRPLYHS